MVLVGSPHVNDKELEILYKRFHQVARPMVFAILRREDDELAWDIASKGILELESFAGDSEVMTWFKTLARRACVDQLRVEARRRETSVEELNEKEWNSLTVDNLGDLALELASVKYLKGERELVEQILEGESYADIGWKLGVSEGTVKKRWERFLERIRRERE